MPPETCPWSLSGPQFPGGTQPAPLTYTIADGNMISDADSGRIIQQRYCYPKGRPEYSSQKGGALWTVCGRDGKEDHEFRLLHVYLSPKRAANKGVPLSREVIASLTSPSSKDPRALPIAKRKKVIRDYQHTSGSNVPLSDSNSVRTDSGKMFLPPPPLPRLLPPPLPPATLTSSHSTSPSSVPGGTHSFCNSPCLSFDMLQPPFSSTPDHSDHGDCPTHRNSGVASRHHRYPDNADVPNHSHEYANTNFVTPPVHFHRCGGRPSPLPASPFATTQFRNRSQTSATAHNIQSSPLQRSTVNGGSADNESFREKCVDRLTPPNRKNGKLHHNQHYHHSLNHYHHSLDPDPLICDMKDASFTAEKGVDGDDDDSVWNGPFLGILTIASSSSSCEAPTAPAAAATSSSELRGGGATTAALKEESWISRLEHLHESLRDSVLAAPAYRRGELVYALSCWARRIAKDPLHAPTSKPKIEAIPCGNNEEITSEATSLAVSSGTKQRNMPSTAAV